MVPLWWTRFLFDRKMTYLASGSNMASPRWHPSPATVVGYQCTLDLMDAYRHAARGERGALASAHKSVPYCQHARIRVQCHIHAACVCMNGRMEVWMYVRVYVCKHVCKHVHSPDGECGIRPPYVDVPRSGRRRKFLDMDLAKLRSSFSFSGLSSFLIIQAVDVTTVRITLTSHQSTGRRSLSV